MKNFSLLITAVIIACFGCKDNLIETTEPIEGIVAGKNDDAYFVSVNDTFEAFGDFNMVINSHIISYDLNNDGIDDIRFKVVGGGASNSYGVSTYILPLDSNQIVVYNCQNSISADNTIVLGLSDNTTITNNFNFRFAPDFEDGFQITYGASFPFVNCFSTDVPMYIAAKINTTDGMQYSWIKVIISTTDKHVKMIVDSYATSKVF